MIADLGDHAEAMIGTADGREMLIAWPAGFGALIAVPPALLDDRGTALFLEGDTVVLEQVSRADHAGTTEDPYVALGIFAGQCWRRGL